MKNQEVREQREFKKIEHTRIKLKFLKLNGAKKRTQSFREPQNRVKKNTQSSTHQLFRKVKVKRNE